jgi:hypothetical protein
MSDMPNYPGRAPKGQDSIDRRAWSQWRQWRAVYIAAVPMIIFILVVWLGGRPFGPQEAPAAGLPSPLGTLRVSAQQLRALTVEAVQTHGFLSEELTDGRQEMFANFHALTADVSESAAVPEAAVVYEGSAAHVWVLAGDNLLSFRTIRTGRRNDGLIEALDGLKLGERVVTNGGLFIEQAAVPAS